MNCNFTQEDFDAFNGRITAPAVNSTYQDGENTTITCIDGGTSGQGLGAYTRENTGATVDYICNGTSGILMVKGTRPLVQGGISCLLWIVPTSSFVSDLILCFVGTPKCNGTYQRRHGFTISVVTSLTVPPVSPVSPQSPRLCSEGCKANDTALIADGALLRGTDQDNATDAGGVLNHGPFAHGDTVTVSVHLTPPSTHPSPSSITLPSLHFTDRRVCCGQHNVSIIL